MSLPGQFPDALRIKILCYGLITIGPCTPKNCILYIAEKGGILVLRICILYNDPESEYFGILLSL